MTKRTILLPDLFISIPVILLLSLGILVIYSSDPQMALQQAVFALVGLVLFWLLSLLDSDSLSQYINFFYIGIFILLLVVFIWGIETRGSVRWIQIAGFNLQPSEFAKPILILFLAKFWSNHLPSWKNILKSFLLITPVLGLIFKQPDLGTALTLVAIWIMMLVGSNASFFKLMLMALAGIVFIPAVWMILKDYQKARIISFLSPSRDPLGIGYNVIQSTIAVGSGQLSGRGLGRGTQSRLRFLPEYRTDFMFASIAEEFGFILSTLVLALYGVLIVRCLLIIGSSGSKSGNLLIFGVVGMLFFQVTVNIGMNIGLVPVTGITLPLLSYGGSSLVATLISLSFIPSVSRLIRKRMMVEED